MTNSDLTILLVSCDEYSDLWDNFFYCKQRFWPDCPYDTVLANNEMNYSYGSLRVINCGANAQWSTRTRIALERINTKYICFLLDDFYFSDTINTQQVKDALQIMQNDNLTYYKLLSFSKISTPFYKESKYLKTIPASQKYGISLLAAIWDKEYFLYMIGSDDYNPWIFEVNRLKEEANTNCPNRLLGVYDNRNILKICHMVVQGKYIPSAVRKMEQLGIVFKYDLRKKMSCKQHLLYKIKKIKIGKIKKNPLIRKVAKLFGIESVSDKYIGKN